MSTYHILILDSQGLVCKFRSFIEWLSCLSGGQDHRGLGEGNWHLLGHWGEGLQCHLNLSLSLEWEGLLNSDCPTGVPSFSHLATSIPWGPAEGEQACGMEWLEECLWPLKAGLADLVSLCRPALAMHYKSSWCSFLMHLSLCLWGEHWVQSHAPHCRDVLHSQELLHQGNLTWST